MEVFDASQDCPPPTRPDTLSVGTSLVRCYMEQVSVKPTKN